MSNMPFMDPKRSTFKSRFLLTFGSRFWHEIGWIVIARESRKIHSFWTRKALIYCLNRYMQLAQILGRHFFTA